MTAVELKTHRSGPSDLSDYPLVALVVFKVSTRASLLKGRWGLRDLAAKLHLPNSISKG